MMSSADAAEVVEERNLNTEYRVTDEQVESLNGAGWALVPGLLGKDVVDEIRAHLAKGTELGPVSGPYDVKISLVRRQGMCWSDPSLRRIATSRRIASAVVQFMKQPAALLAQDISFNKPAGGGVARLHQDYSYFPCVRKGGLTLWIALVDQTEDMGPINYLEASHLEGPLGYIDPTVNLQDT
jgi:hypothetical protein